MDNSLVTHLRAYASAMLKDVASAYAKPSELRRDSNRLFHELAIHGSRVLTLDLPALLKHFDKCLDEGLYSSSGLRYGKPKKGTRTPVLFGSLYLKIFNSEGKLRDTPCITSIFYLRSLLGSLKKLELPCKQWSVDDEVRNFISIEKEMRSPTNSWQDDVPDFSSKRPHFRDGLNTITDSPTLFANGTRCELGAIGASLDTLQRVCDRVSSQFGDFHNERITELPKHGPGVVANQRRGTSKYLFKYWPAKLQAIFPYDMYATTNFGLGYNHDREVDWGLNHEFPSRLISVPKTLKAPRLIAAEPVEHQWIQQLIMHQLETRIQETVLWDHDKSRADHTVNFRSQSRNQKLAYLGSKDGSLATVDLKAASDRLSCWTVERAFRSNLTILERLHASRTRWLRNGITPSLGEYIPLKKFAAMGSAVTFPVQSIVYACIAITALIRSENLIVSSGSIEKCARRVCVFGDDIIVPKHALGVLVQLLEYCGLEVNTSKTFGTGKFRESCGVDAYEGHDVTPAYFKPSCTSVQPSDVGRFLMASNNFHKKGLWNVANWLLSLVDQERNKLPIVHTDEGSPGWFSYCGRDTSRLKRRYSETLHRFECLQLLPFSRVDKLPIRGTYRLFQWFTEKPQPDTRWVSGAIGKAVAYWRRGWAQS